MSRLATLACLLAALFVSVPAVASDRLALVIGNGAYRNISALPNPINDARLMSRTLEDAGFRVTMITDADRATMERAVERFGEDLRAARPGTVALFHFAGHGLRSDGFNYLVPVNVNLRTEADIARETIAAEWIIERMKAPGVTSVMVLDACRNNPFDNRGPEFGDGLARMQAKDGNLIAYATGPGDIALDGTGSNSPYTAALARAIRNPDLDLQGVFERVRDEVVAATAGEQTPWETSDLDRAVFIQPGFPQAPAEISTGAPPTKPAVPQRKSPAEPAVGTLAAASTESPPKKPAVTEAPQQEVTVAVQPEKTPAPQPEDTSGGARTLRLEVTFNAGPLGRERPECNGIYRYDPFLAPAASARRISSDKGVVDAMLEVSAINGDEIGIAPVSGNKPGRVVTFRLSDLAPGKTHTIYGQVRHPELFACGPMTFYVREMR